MGYILPCLSTDDANNQFDDTSKMVWLAISVYFCTILQCGLLALLIYNIWKFLYKQGKWRVWMLSLFYVLSVICMTMRIFVTYWVVCETNTFSTVLTLGTAVLKIAVGLV